jgi:hypothetical protein
MYTYRVVDEAGTVLGTQEFDELNIGECIANDADVYVIRSLRIIGPAADNRRELRVTKTVDTVYVARLD